MAPLTWREVAAPNFSGVTESQRLAGQLLDTGFDSAIKTLDGLNTSQKSAASSEFVSRVAAFTNPAELDAALKSGTLFDGLSRNQIAPEDLQWADTHRRNMLGDTQTSTLTQGYSLNNANQAEANSQQVWTNDQTQAFEAARPAAVQRQAEIDALAAQDTPAALAQAQQLTKESAGIFAAAGFTPAGISGVNAGTMDTNIAGVAMAKLHQEWGDANLDRNDRLQVEALLNQVVGVAGSPQDAARMIRGNPDLSTEVITMALDALETQGPALFGGDVSPAAFILDQTVRERQAGTTTPGASATPPGLSGLVSLVDRTEGAGNYSTLFSHAQLDNGPFAGVDVSTKTIGELDDFSGEYGAWVKGQIGRVATPMGRFQIVNSTLQDAAKEMGLSPDTVFNEDTQNAIFQHLVNKRLSGPKSMEGKMAGLREEWEGFKSVPDSQLQAAIEAYQSGDTSALSFDTPGSSNSSGSNDPVQAALDVATKATAADLTATQNQDFLNAGTFLVNKGQTILDTITSDNMFGNQSLLTELVERPNMNLTRQEIVRDMVERMGGVDENGLLDNGLSVESMAGEMAAVQNKYGLAPDMAAAFMLNAVDRNMFGTRWFFGQLTVDGGEFARLVASFYNKDGKTPAERLKGSITQLEAIRTKASAAALIQQQQQQVQAAQQAYFNAAERKKIHPNVDVEGPKLLYEALLGQMQGALEQINADTLIRSNTNSNLPF